jgi:hypothetical protein
MVKTVLHTVGGVMVMVIAVVAVYGYFLFLCAKGDR